MLRAQTLFRVRGTLLVLLAFLVIAGSVLTATSVQRSAEQRGFDRVQNSQQLLTAWLARANVLRVFLNTGSPAALASFDRSVGPFQAAVQTERTDVRGVPGGAAVLASEIRFAQRWQNWALVGVAQIHRHGLRPLSLAITKPRTDAAAAFQVASERLTAVMENRRKRDISVAEKIGAGIVVLAFLIVTLAALAVARARRRRDARAVDARFREERAPASVAGVAGRRDA
jgi:hypothetical protein